MRVLLFLILLIVVQSARAQTLIRGPIVSAVTDTSARVLIQLDMPASVSIELSEAEDFTQPVVISSTVNAEKAVHYFVKFDIQGLHSSTQYFLRAVINGITHPLAPLRSFKTFPKHGDDVP